MKCMFQVGRNCWKIAHATRASFLVDAAAYYRAFSEAAEKAASQIIISAWDIDGRIPLCPEKPRENLRQFFLRLLEHKSSLHIFVLNWKFFLIYLRDREMLPLFDAAWRTHPRLHFEWDSAHPLGACHHQKVVVIDNRLAFVGGLDFTHERWDTPRHSPQNPERRDRATGKSYKPFHDAVFMAEGPLAASLGELNRLRWERSKNGNGDHVGRPTDISSDAPSLWPRSVPVDLEDSSIAICRTEPGYHGQPAVREIESLYIDMIRAARRFVYIESQFFTAAPVIAAIQEYLSRTECPEFIVLLPKGFTDWVEEWSFGLLRSRFIRELRQADRWNRLHFYYPTVAGLRNGDYIKVHSKLMIVDDLSLRLGSANLCNRSMAVDTECDVALETHAGTPVHAAIRRFRERLMAEHLGCSMEDVGAAMSHYQSVAKTIHALHAPSRGLVEFNGEVTPWVEKVGVGLTALDLTHPFL